MKRANASHIDYIKGRFTEKLLLGKFAGLEARGVAMGREGERKGVHAERKGKKITRRKRKRHQNVWKV